MSRLSILTIVLDGLPWLTHHLPIFQRLEADWHWYIVEGAAMNTRDTRWCKPQEPRLSNDGTTEYLNGLKSHPRVTVIQREQWDGKVEMVNTPLKQVTEPGVLLQLDADELWEPKSLDSMVRLFEMDDTFQRMRFRCEYFIGPNIVTKEEKPSWWLRAWRFEPGMTFEKHEPPTLAGNRGKCLDNEYLTFDHMSYVLESQVSAKEKFYGYDGAVAQWKRLQANTEWPVKRLTDFLPWAGKNSSADLLVKPATSVSPMSSQDPYTMPTLDEILDSNRPRGTLPGTVAMPATPPPIPASQAHKNRAGPFPRPLVRRFLVVINFYDGDHETAVDLANLIFDLQKERSPDTDIMFYHRNDARPMEPAIIEKMRLKFLKVYSHKCSRLNAKGHPYGCNEMWYSLVELMRSPKWIGDYYAFYNMEPDCTPLHPDWLMKVSKEFRLAEVEGFAAVGQVKDNPVRHLNGAAIYSTNFFNRAGGMDLIGGSSNVGYDVHHAKRILPVTLDSSMFGGRWGVPSLTDNEVWQYRRGDGECVILHAGKDASVRDAVRRKWLGK